MKQHGISIVTPEVANLWVPAMEQHLTKEVFQSLGKNKKNLLIGMANSHAVELMQAGGVTDVGVEAMQKFFAGAIGSTEGFIASSAANSGTSPVVSNPVNGGHNGFAAQSGAAGSGDRQYMIGLCIAIAANTVGLEVVQSLPATSQNIVVDFLDVKYSGGELNGAGKVNVHMVTLTFSKVPELKISNNYAIKVGNEFITAKFRRADREVKNGYIFEVMGRFGATVSGTDLSNLVYEASTNYSRGAKGGVLVVLAADLTSFTTVKVDTADVTVGSIAHTSAVENYVSGQTTMGLRRTLTRKEADAGSDVTMELSLQNESFTIGNRTFNGHISRLEFKRITERGIDPMKYLSTAMKNEVSQEVNWQIISAARALGIQNALAFQDRGMSFNTLFAPAAVASKAFGSLLQAEELTDFEGNEVAAKFNDIPNLARTMQYETIASLGSAICMIIKQAAYSIGTDSRYGDADAVILPAGLAAYVSAASEFTALNGKNVAIDSKSGAKSIGSIGDIKVYVDVQQYEASPFITVLRTNTNVSVDVPGVSEEQPILMPGLVYVVKDLISSIELTPESTGGRKIIMDSETDLITVGRRPEAGYLTFAVDIAIPGLSMS